MVRAGAIKWWIGNAAEDGQWATVFARLRIPTDGAKGGVKDHGVHAFICPLRNEDGSLVSGVEIRDCGYKVGLNGAPNLRHKDSSLLFVWSLHLLVAGCQCRC